MNIGRDKGWPPATVQAPPTFAARPRPQISRIAYTSCCPHCGLPHLTKADYMICLAAK